MKYDFQRADMMKRVPAWMLDIILLLVLTTGIAYLCSLVIDVETPRQEYDALSVQYQVQCKADYEAKNGKLPVYTDQELSQMTAEQKAEVEQKWSELTESEKLEAQNAMTGILEEADKKLQQDEKAAEVMAVLVSNWLTIISLSVLGAYTILEFVIPVLLKNGQTIGKKCFGIALMRKDGIKVTPLMMFARTVLGKCTVETMLPLLMLLLGGWPLVITGVGILLAPAVVALFTKNKTAIHDLMACTVAVDLSSQMIFDTVEEMEAHNAEIEASAAFRAE